MVMPGVCWYWGLWGACSYAGSGRGFARILGACVCEGARLLSRCADVGRFCTHGTTALG